MKTKQFLLIVAILMTLIVFVILGFVMLMQSMNPNKPVKIQQNVLDENGMFVSDKNYSGFYSQTAGLMFRYPTEFNFDYPSDPKIVFSATDNNGANISVTLSDPQDLNAYTADSILEELGDTLSAPEIESIVSGTTNNRPYAASSYSYDNYGVKNRVKQCVFNNSSVCISVTFTYEDDKSEAYQPVVTDLIQSLYLTAPVIPPAEIDYENMVFDESDPIADFRASVLLNPKDSTDTTGSKTTAAILEDYFDITRYESVRDSINETSTINIYGLKANGEEYDRYLLSYEDSEFQYAAVNGTALSSKSANALLYRLRSFADNGTEVGRAINIVRDSLIGGYYGFNSFGSVIENYFTDTNWWAGYGAENKVYVTLSCNDTAGNSYYFEFLTKNNAFECTRLDINDRLMKTEDYNELINTVFEGN